MKRIFNVVTMTVLLLVVGFAAQTANAAGFMDNPTPLDYERYESYFEKNNSGLTGDTSYLLFNEQTKFDKIFGVAGSMSNKSFLPEDVFENRFIFSVIKRGNFTVSYQVTNVVRDFDKLRIYYDTTTKPMKSATFRSPLILAIDKENFDYSRMIVTENGKEVYKVSFKD